MNDSYLGAAVIQNDRIITWNDSRHAKCRWRLRYHQQMLLLMIFLNYLNDM
jgi:hypothetical protein